MGLPLPRNAVPMNDSSQDSTASQALDGPLDAPLDIRALMANIRASVAKEIETHGRQRPAFKPEASSPSTTGTRKAGELLQSEELRYLNSNYSFSSRLNFDGLQSHRPGFLGRTIVAVKRKLMRVIFDSLLKEYFAAERDFNANVVRMFNDISKYVDSRDASNFWELIRKIDVDTTKALERIERLSDEYGASLRSTERRVFDELYAGLREVNGLVTTLQGSSQRHEASLKTLDSVARGLEGAVARVSAPLSSASAPSASAQQASETSAKAPDQSYVLLENRFRGSEAEIRERLTIYPPLFAVDRFGGDPAVASSEVLEIGSGRGELQILFKEAGIPARGIDMDGAMVQVAAERGVKTAFGDGLRALEEAPDRSLRGVIAIQVVEHLTRQQLETLMKLCSQKVRAGGVVVFETINPQSLTALSSNYFRDPTHVWPMHPDTLSYMMTLGGLDVQEVRLLSPVPDGALLRSLAVEDYMTPRWMEMVTLFNHNISRLNSLLYGHQDYCVIAKVP